MVEHTITIFSKYTQVHVHVVPDEVLIVTCGHIRVHCTYSIYFRKYYYFNLKQVLHFIVDLNKILFQGLFLLILTKSKGIFLF